MKTIRLCPNCGGPLPPDAPGGLCPQCLLKSDVPSQSAVAGFKPRFEPEPGQLFGGYRIVRLLGEGGMGAVYEAEDVESGRRVALKILRHAPDSPTARQRFLREGRLAASVNHPNSVYIYGAGEIDGAPVITMEYVPGGTLSELVKRRGPLPVAEAVDAILQIMAGLEAAAAKGVLHRDVKPSNCFVEADGTVKVGDFGLSISTLARDQTALTMSGAIMGTPTYASPEQLRGDELDVRADIYSVGVTLYFLLTGKTPFHADNMVKLLATVLEKPAPSPRAARPEIPKGVEQIVLRCLAKQPAQRFKDYDQLRHALAPFSSEAPVPAPLGLRFLAGAVDTILTSGVLMTVSLVAVDDLATYINPTSYRSPKYLALMGASVLVTLFYYAVLEGLWGRSIGKAICRLRVAGPDRNLPGAVKAFLRAAVYVILPPLPIWIAYGFGPLGVMATSSTWVREGAGFAYYVLLALLFCTARRRNGLAALHDLLTSTRVIKRAALERRPQLTSVDDSIPQTSDAPGVGPFHVLDSLAHHESEEILLGYDTRLLRKVWIRKQPLGTAPTPASRRELTRKGRLHWLASRRSATECWDAYEAVSGQPLVNLLNQPQAWKSVRYWLLDLAEELDASRQDGSGPETLGLDRVWITADGRAKLLDFSAPGSSRRDGPPEGGTPNLPPPADQTTMAKQFLNQFACAALEGRGEGSAATGKKCVSTPLPLHARDFLDKLPALPGTEAIVAALKPLLNNFAVVSRWRRAGLIAGCAAFPVMVAIGMMFGMHKLNNWQRSQPDIMPLSQVLNYRTALRLPWMKSKTGPDDRAFAIYIASHFRETITNAASWSGLFAASFITGENRKFAEQSVADHPNPTEQEIKDATAAVKPHLPRSSSINVALKPWYPLVACAVGLMAYVALPSLLMALLFRGGLVLRVAGVAVVRKDGARASRLRVLWRSLVTWSPFLLIPVLAPVLLAMRLPPIVLVAVAALLGVLVIGLTVWSLALPERSLQDRIAGTWLVPK